MLKKFDSLIKKILCESAGNDDDEKKIREAYHTNEFYYRFLDPVAEETHVLVTKNRNNTFLIYGSLKAIEDFFKALKVDETFMENPSEFKIYSPMFSYGENAHYLKMDEDYPTVDKIGEAPYTHAIDNQVRNTVHGRWYSLVDEDKAGQKIKGVKPSEVSKYFKSIFPKADKNFNNETEIYFEFQVNCEDWKNQIYDEMSEYAKEPDEMNEYHNEDPDDFDYTQLNVKNVNDDAIVKNALKEIKRTDKDYSKK